MTQRLLIVMAVALIASACSGGSGGSSGGSGGGVSFSCDIVNSTKNECDTTRGISSQLESSLSTQCTVNMHGKVVSACPTTNVIGCCTLPLAVGTSVEGCFYKGESSPTTQAQCTSSGGTYSKTP